MESLIAIESLESASHFFFCEYTCPRCGFAWSDTDEATPDISMDGVYVDGRQGPPESTHDCPNCNHRHIEPSNALAIAGGAR